MNKAMITGIDMFESQNKTNDVIFCNRHSCRYGKIDQVYRSK